MFRGKFIDLLRRTFIDGRLAGIPDEAAFERLIESSVKTEWIVYAKPPFGGPEQVLKYLSRYTHRIAISNRRLVSMDDHTVTFRWKDYAQGNRPRTMTLEAGEFLRRFLMHVVPRHFMRIRHFGFLANRGRRKNAENCRNLLGQQGRDDGCTGCESHPAVAELAPTLGIGICPLCGRGRMVKGELLKPQPLLRFLPRLDSS